MHRFITLIGCGFATMFGVSPAAAQTSVYLDETEFLQAIAELGLEARTESFEDDAAWGAVRSTVVDGFRTAPEVTSQGITWYSSSPGSGVTTGSGAARTGSWGVYSIPHGDILAGIRDGFGGRVDEPLVAIGAWVETNTPYAKVGLFLDGDFAQPLDFGDANTIGAQSEFFGVVRPSGFTRFDFRELEGAAEELKFIFGDDVSFAFDGSGVVDCNENGVPDARDISDGTSQDRNGNGVPDACESFSLPPFRRGDGNDDGSVDISDAVHTLTWLFAGGAPPGCVAAANVNGDQVVDISDAVHLLGFLFAGEALPTPPFPGCGDSSEEADLSLGCEEPPRSCL